MMMGTNKHFEVGYQPNSRSTYSHKLHAGDLGIDCRYCHSTVERSRSPRFRRRRRA